MGSQAGLRIVVTWKEFKQGQVPRLDQELCTNAGSVFKAVGVGDSGTVLVSYSPSSGGHSWHRLCSPRQVGLPQHFPRRPFPIPSSPGGGPGFCASISTEIDMGKCPFPQSRQRRGRAWEGVPWVPGGSTHGCGLDHPAKAGWAAATDGRDTSKWNRTSGGDKRGFFLGPLTRGETEDCCMNAANTLVAPHCHNCLKVLCGGAEISEHLNSPLLLAAFLFGELPTLPFSVSPSVEWKFLCYPSALEQHA